MWCGGTVFAEARDVVWCLPNACEEDLGMALGAEKKKSSILNNMNINQ